MLITNIHNGIQRPLGINGGVLVLVRRYAAVSMSIGFGQGTATIVERLDRLEIQI